MPGWVVDVLDVVGILVAVALLYVVSLVARRRLLSRHGGTFELSHLLGGDHVKHDDGDHGRGRWVLGLGRYSGDELEWFRIFTLSLGPKRRWRRSELSYEQVRQPDTAERDVLYPDHLVVSCADPAGDLELAMSRASLTGFQAWLESRTPGTDWSQ